MPPPRKCYISSSFTLAEILVTLGIIGIIAAVTMPTLITNHKKQVMVTSLKTNYSIIQQAMATAVADNNIYTVNINGTRTSVRGWFETYLKPYIKTTKVCYGENGCWHKEGDTKYLNGNIVYQNAGTIGLGATNTLITFELINGAQFDIDYYGGGSMNSHFVTNTNGKTSIGIYMDINGNKGPNTLGKDIFVLGYSEKGIQPAGAESSETTIKNDCKKGGTGRLCLQYIIQNSWHIPDDYPL